MRASAGLGILLLAVAVNLAAAELSVIKIPRQQPNMDIARDYYVQLLHMTLINGAAGRAVPKLRETTLMEQERAISELNRGGLVDVYWMGTSLERERQLRAIRIPLDRGLLGYRRFIIHRDNQEKFDAIVEYEQLKKYLGCQGINWPDVHIMRAASLRVTEVALFEGLFQQVVAKRCDFFSRGYFEAQAELSQRSDIYPDLQLQKTLVLHYPFAVYFFVKHDNEYLAKWIEDGLEKIIDSGEMIEFMTNHPLTAHVFPLNKKDSPRYIINIPNPQLSPDTDHTNPRYWFQPADFSATVELVVPK